jgi:hypothetical protein
MFFPNAEGEDTAVPANSTPMAPLPDTGSYLHSTNVVTLERQLGDFGPLTSLYR